MKDIREIDLKQLIESETGERFNRSGFIRCPFHNDKKPSMSVKFIPDANKERYSCWSCGVKGDAIDFIMNYKGMEYNEARKYLGLEVELPEAEIFKQKMEKSAEYQITKGRRKGYKLQGIFTFVDKNNKPIYCKIKFLRPDGTKETPYYSLDEEGNILNSRSHDEVPYNYYNLLQGIASNKVIIPVEGEKDANMINKLLDKRKYVATSLKGLDNAAIQDLFMNSEFLRVYCIGDTGKAGQKYIDKIKSNVLRYCKEFKIINLSGIQALGDNADVTDWLEAGHTKEELLNCFKRSLDLKDKDELQQDDNGIYCLKFPKKPDENGEYKPKRVYFTNFKVLEASKINKIDVDIQGIRLKLESCISGRIIEKVGSSKIFDDQRAFRNFLGMDYSFLGSNMQELVRLKDWINKYFALDNKEIYLGTKFVPVEGTKQFELITSTGTLRPDTKDYSRVCESSKIDLIDVPEITKDELEGLMQYLLSFLEYGQAISVIGSVISFLMVGQNIEANEKLHHLLIVGESGSGKSTILERVVAPLLNYPLEEKKAISTTAFATQKLLSTGNYPIMFDEFKPSMLDDRKRLSLSDILRNSYDRTAISRGDKSLNLREFKLTRPVIIAGEESYYNNEKALTTRSCIVYIGKDERTAKTSEAMYFLMEHEDLLKKLGKTLIKEVLNLSTDEYKKMHFELRQAFNLKDRPLNTAINIATGIELLNKVLEKFNLQPVGLDYLKHIENNMRAEVLDNGEDSKSTVEQMLCLYNDLLQDKAVFCNPLAINYKEQGKIYIRTQMVIDSIFKYAKDYQSTNITLLKVTDFKKQAKKAGYIKGSKQIRVSVGTDFNATTKPMWFDEYDRNKLAKLGLDSMLDTTDMELEDAVSNFESNVRYL